MKVDAWTDGSSCGKVGKGGWAYVAKYVLNGEEKEFCQSGSEPVATNNSMELTAVLRVIERVKDGTVLVIHTDSLGVINWLLGNWGRYAETVITLCKQIEETAIAKNVKYSFEKVKGHSTDLINNRADKMANEARNATVD